MDSTTNVCLLARSIKYIGDDGVPQLVFYDQGVGTEVGTLERIQGGAMGVGIDLNIQQLYTFLAMNYVDGDEIYLFGFSRGAYTVRSLAGMMNESGLLYRNKLEYVKEAYDLYRENDDLESEQAKKFRGDHSRRVPIKLLTCFDTVGALGIPKTAPFPVSMFRKEDRFKFHNTTLGDHVENAIHVVSIDENFVTFDATLMDPHESRGPSQVTQIYMAGNHSAIGGGNKNNEVLARNALKCVVEEMEKRNLGLDLDYALIPKQYCLTHAPSEKVPLLSMWGVIGALTGLSPRKIKSHEVIHHTAKEMYRMHKNWRPPSLEPLSKYILD